ncbi:tyrosine-protein phosphatase [Daejeonella oryzae]|uniref:tyrosine-protein phosphatase n=1 Tax=Daejeonella oryzae TaxID=1122943 RepID=UPI0004240D2C|nr:CpsB/CapC family capsule biosynthesis tyrosine phosphatase [Daejeonella oryzae]
MFGLFKKSQPSEPQIDFSGIAVDLHSHMIPGVDDGAQTVEESVALVSAMKDLGFQKIITTPHIMADYYRNTRDTIERGLDILREELIRQNINMPVEAAAEYYLDESFDTKLQKGDLMTIGDGFLLFEISFVNFPTNMFETIERIKDKGLKPILAHPERYPYLTDSLDKYRQIKESGCYLQLNTISLTGYYGKGTQKAAEELVNNMLIDFIASDMHHLKHAGALKRSLNLPLVRTLLTDYQLQNTILL